MKSTSSASGGTIKIGFISPETGQLSVFTQSNKYVLGQVRAALAKGLTIGGKKYSVEIISADSQSSSARAAAVASQLVQQNSVDMLLATATPETVIPVSAQAESSGVPCVLTICPWEQWYYKSDGTPNTFKYSYMYFLGTQEETDLFASVWKTAATNHVVGGLWPDDVDGAGFKKYVTQEAHGLGWKVVPSGAYADGTSDFTPIISKFKNANVEILHAVPIPPDFITFWRQAHQNGFKPKIASISKALLFPSAADALGKLVTNVMSPLWWSPQFPYKCSLDGVLRVGVRGRVTRPAPGASGPSRWASTTRSSRSRSRRSRRPATRRTGQRVANALAGSRARRSPATTTSVQRAGAERVAGSRTARAVAAGFGRLRAGRDQQLAAAGRAGGGLTRTAVSQP